MSLKRLAGCQKEGEFMAAKVVKMCDMPLYIAVKVFEALNSGKVKVEGAHMFDAVIITDTEPMDLVYPEGWYYAKGCFRNKHQSTTGSYYEAQMMMSDGTWWGEKVNYCTLND